MSAIYASLIEAAQSGVLTTAFDELIEELKKELLSGKMETYMYPVESEIAGGILVKRLEAEGITDVSVVKSDEEIRVKVNLMPIFADAKAKMTPAPKIISGSAALFLRMNPVDWDAHHKTAIAYLKSKHLNPIVENDYTITCPIPDLRNESFLAIFHWRSNSGKFEYSAGTKGIVGLTDHLKGLGLNAIAVAIDTGAYGLQNSLMSSCKLDIYN